MIDHEVFERSFGGLQFETKLLPESSDEGRALKLRSRICSRLGSASGFRLELEGEIEAARKAGLVHYGTIQPAHSSKCASEQRHCDVARSAFSNVFGIDAHHDDVAYGRKDVASGGDRRVCCRR